jgi:hypothetical protein
MRLLLSVFRPRALSACLTLLALACSGSGGDQGDAAAGGLPTRIRDTTGAAFEFIAGDLVKLRPVDGLAIECSGKQIEEFAFWRGMTGLAMVCGIDPNSQSAADYLCRPIACDSAAECPSGFGCDQGLCQCLTGECMPLDGGHRIHSLELMARCLAPTPRFPRCLDAFTDPSWGMVSRILLTECDGEGLCTVPEECR